MGIITEKTPCQVSTKYTSGGTGLAREQCAENAFPVMLCRVLKVTTNTLRRVWGHIGNPCSCIISCTNDMYMPHFAKGAQTQGTLFPYLGAALVLESGIGFKY